MQTDKNDNTAFQAAKTRADLRLLAAYVQHIAVMVAAFAALYWVPDISGVPEILQLCIGVLCIGVGVFFLISMFYLGRDKEVVSSIILLELEKNADSTIATTRVKSLLLSQNGRLLQSQLYAYITDAIQESTMQKEVQAQVKLQGLIEDMDPGRAS